MLKKYTLRQQQSMAVEVTLKLPENLVEHAKKLGLATQRDLGTVLTNMLEMLWLTVEEIPDVTIYTPVSELSDDEVLVMADAKMDEVQNQRLADLQDKGKAEGLTEAERYELLGLLQIYQIGQIRKSEALAEAVYRGLRKPLIA